MESKEEIIENPITTRRVHFRRNIKKVMDFKNLTPESKIAYQQEKQRKKEYVKSVQSVRTLPFPIYQTKYAPVLLF